MGQPRLNTSLSTSATEFVIKHDSVNLNLRGVPVKTLHMQDVHYGDGTQLAFKERCDVLVCSIHRYDGGCFYPYSSDGAMQNIGEGPGRCWCSGEIVCFRT